MVDGKSLVGLTHDEAVAILKATQKLVQLVVATEHLEEGESINSSLQSIPEMYLGRSHPHAILSAENSTVAPEPTQSPQRNAFQQSIEMAEKATPPKQSSPESMETSMDDPDVRIVKILTSEGEPLGLKISEGYSERSGTNSIFVRATDPHGVVGRSKQLHVGDELLAVNNTSLQESTQQEAIAILTVSYYCTVTSLCSQDVHILPECQRRGDDFIHCE